MQPTNPTPIPNYRIVTISGRIGSGSTTLAKELSQVIGWRRIEGGDIFWEAVRKKMGLDPKETNLRPDQEDELFDAQLKKILHEDKNIILETKLAGFNAQGIEGILKILVVCENDKNEDQTQIRIDRLVNRENVSVDEAKAEVLEREKNDLEKWRRIYANGDENWTYYDKKYYDIVINTYSHHAREGLSYVLEKLGINS